MNFDDFNKIAGAVIGSLLVFLLLGFFGGQIFGTRGHHGDHEPLAFALDTGGGDEGGQEEAGVDYAALVAAADPAKGEKAFSKCKACHAVEDGKNGTGPHLWGVVNREIGGVSGFGYSDALASKGGVWDLAALDGFLANPKGWAPGTKMSFGGMKKVEDRVNLIVYLNEADGSPEELAAASEDAPTEEASTEEAATEEASTEEAATEEATSGSGFDALLAAADADAGKKVYRKCGACHKVEDGAKGVGPHLWGIVGREIGALDGYSYSDALAGKGGTWDLTALDAFLADPKGWAPGTKMGFNGIKDPQDRVNVIAYLNDADGSPEELSASEGAEVSGAGEQQAATLEATEEPAAEEPAAEEAQEESADEPAEEASAAGGEDFSALLAAADGDAGKKVFRMCAACHKLKDGAKGVGPHLWGVVGRDIASVEGFKYSDALAGKEGVWDLANMMAWLEDPKGWAKGNKMTFKGISDPQDRINVITYINEADGSPEPLQ